MGNLLSYLFEVTERFGMPTRTELILLQRTMVVVEGVARSLDPNLNIWDAAKPVVSDYIKASVGPKAAISDLTHIARRWAGIGPLLPRIIEQALWERAHPEEARLTLIQARSSGTLIPGRASGAGGGGRDRPVALGRQKQMISASASARRRMATVSVMVAMPRNMPDRSPVVWRIRRMVSAPT